MHYAAKRGDRATVQILPDFEAQSKSEGALEFASDRDAKGLPVLLEAMDDMGCTALTKAAWRGRASVVRLLLEAGADACTKDLRGETALHHLSAPDWHQENHNFQEIAKLLITHGANLNAADEDGNTPLHLAIDSWHQPNSRKIKRLMHLGPSLEIKNNLQQTPLDTAKSLLEQDPHVLYSKLPWHLKKGGWCDRFRIAYSEIVSLLENRG